MSSKQDTENAPVQLATPSAETTPLPLVDPATGEVKASPGALVPHDEGEGQAPPARALSAFVDKDSFETAQRMARALSSSSLVPEAYRGQSNMPNVMIAMELANRIGASVLMVMQSLDVIHGRPSWRAQFLIATVNASSRFTPLRFRFQGKEGSDDWGCRAWAKDRESGEECTGALITMGLAKAEGWASKAGSKWKTMPEQMLMYRAAAFWTRIYAPELSLGMQTTEETVDTTGYEIRETPEALRPGSAADLERSLRNGATAQ